MLRTDNYGSAIYFALTLGHEKCTTLPKRRNRNISNVSKTGKPELVARKKQLDEQKKKEI